MSNVSTDSGQGAWYRMRPEVACGSCNTITLHGHCQMCKSAGDFCTVAWTSGMVLTSYTACQLGHHLPSLRIAGCQPWAVLHGSQLLLPAMCEMRWGAAMLAAAPQHHRSSPELPHLQQWEDRSLFAKATITLCCWKGYRGHGEGLSPLWTLMIT